MKRRVVILGSTGSIGRQALDVIEQHPDRFEVVALATGSKRDELRRQAVAFGVTATGLGADEAVELASMPEADVVLNAIVGAAGLRASVAALSSGKTLALANKESLVAGGEVCLAAARDGGGTIVPVDSEHAALAQCLEGRDRDTVARLVLTASGGPFRTRENLTTITPQDALAHPTWAMGPKITIDSATLMNKGLETIEAHYLFGFGYDDIDVIVHPQSLVHGMVEFVDGSLLMQAAPTDMRIPILSALSSPDRVGPPAQRLDLVARQKLEFEDVDRTRFPSLDLAYQAGRAGGSAPAVLNAANEEAVAAFLGGKVSFTDIPRVVESVLSAHSPAPVTTVEEVLDVDGWGRQEARRALASSTKEMVTG